MMNDGKHDFTPGPGLKTRGTLSCIYQVSSIVKEKQIRTITVMVNFSVL